MTFRGSDAEQILITELSQRAQSGIKEAGYLMDEGTGLLLNFCEAHDDTPYEVDFPEKKIREAEREGQRVTYLHSHPVDSPPSESDWANMVSFSAVSRYLTVCETRVFEMERTAQTRNPHRISAAVVFLFEQKQLLMRSSVSHLSLRQALREISEVELFDLLRAVNEKMAQTYAVRFQEVQL